MHSNNIIFIVILLCIVAVLLYKLFKSHQAVKEKQREMDGFNANIITLEGVLWNSEIGIDKLIEKNDEVRKSLNDVLNTVRSSREFLKRKKECDECKKTRGK